jgi:3-dehydroquinate synthase
MTIPAREALPIDAGGYPVYVASMLRHTLPSLVEQHAPAHHYAIITDSHVGPLYADSVRAALSKIAKGSVHTVPAGEAHKSRESWSRITDELFQAGCARDTTIIALGGGVVGDLAGFVAATFMRGVPVVQVPTSLLAMIDASVGGKTGVDTPAGKNLVGAFHLPAFVVADVQVLSSLPDAHRRAGLAEAIKHGIIADASYLERIESNLANILAAVPDATLDLVTRSVEIKADVVRADPREHGLRKTLNFGHTIGHAIEHVSGYSLLHGECVAIGMVLEARIAEHIGVAEPGTADAVAGVLARASLPIAQPADMSPSAILEATRLDKKARAGRVEYALPVRIGMMAEADGRWAIPIDDDVVREVLA